MFAGVGGIRLGFEGAGCRCVFSSEIDKEARKTYCANFQEYPYGDVREISEDVPDFDILCADFPCQPFSLSGKLKGFEDTRGTLFFEICRIAAIKKPKVLFLENVKNLLYHDSGRTFSTIVDSLEILGYHTSFSLCDASSFGIPQHRERVIIVGVREGVFDFSVFNDLKNQKKPALADFLDAKQEMSFLDSHEYTLLANPKVSKAGTIFAGYLNNKTFRVKDVNSSKLHISGTHRQPYRIWSIHGVFPTLNSTETSGRYWICNEEKKVRKLTLAECWRLMGFPSDFKTLSSTTQQYKQLGNSVVVPMIRTIAEQLVKCLK